MEGKVFEQKILERSRTKKTLDWLANKGLPVITLIYLLAVSACYLTNRELFYRHHLKALAAAALAALVVAGLRLK